MLGLSIKTNHHVTVHNMANPFKQVHALKHAEVMAVKVSKTNFMFSSLLTLLPSLSLQCYYNFKAYYVKHYPYLLQRFPYFCNSHYRVKRLKYTNGTITCFLKCDGELAV